jgi:hypothetical protein
MTRPRLATPTALGLLVALLLLVAPAATPALASTSTSTSTSTSASTAPSWGSATAQRQTLRAGCRSYPFHYRIDVPGDAWMAEITLASPAGRHLSTVTYESGRQADVGTGRFRFCDVSTRPGRHTISVKVTSYDARDRAVRRTAPTTFRLVHR